MLADCILEVLVKGRTAKANTRQMKYFKKRGKKKKKKERRDESFTYLKFRKIPSLISEAVTLAS